MAQIERKTNRYERKEPIEDRTAAVIAFENGARYVLETDTPATGIGSEVFIHGTAGMLRLANYTELSRLSGSGWSPITPLPDTNQFDELLGWLRGQTEHRNAAVRSRQTIELMLAIYESVRTRGVVELPLTNPANPLRQLIDGERLPLTDTEPYDIRLPN